MHKDKIAEIHTEMGDQNHISAFNIIKILSNTLLYNDHETTYKIIELFLFILIVLAMFGPFVTIVLIRENTPLIINFISCFFYLIAIFGLLGRCTCCCFYRPCNWIFTMLISDLVTMALNITIIVLTASHDEFKDNDTFVIIISGFNTAFFLSIIGSHFKAFIVLRDVYIRSREYEINIIKKCVIEFVNKEI